jgi:S1-C subfamily serine protease
MIRVRSLFWILLLLVCSPACPQLREYVAVVEPVFHPGTVKSLATCARFFAEQGQHEIARYFAVCAGLNGPQRYGSGWVFLSPKGNVFVITNRHVVIQAEHANVIFEDIEGRRREFAEVPIVYVDDERDIAILQLPPESFESGLSLAQDCPPDGTTVFAVGYPGFNGEPLWQFSSGIVSNAAARIDSDYRYLIQHTAPIDRGNSGGPLLVQWETPAGKSRTRRYAVAGMNVSVAAGRQNTNFAIPVEELATAIAASDRAVAIAGNPEARREDLLNRAWELREVLIAEQPDFQQLRRYVSFRFVAGRGLLSLVEVLYLGTNDRHWIQAMISDPIGAMRSAIVVRITYDLARVTADVGAVDIVLRDQSGLSSMNDTPGLDRLNPADVIARYSCATGFCDVVWTWEYGRWYVAGYDTRDLVKIKAFRNNGGEWYE